MKFAKTILVSIFVVLGQGCVDPQPGPNPQPSPLPLVSATYWILNGPGLEAQAMATDPGGIAFFSKSNRIVFYPEKHNVLPPASWKTIIWRHYTSFAQFQSDISVGNIIGSPAICPWVSYDPESWSYTPANEQADPIGYTIQFAKLAHLNGYKVMAQPAEDLMGALYPGQNKYTAFINFGMASAVAPYVDLFHIQSQGLQQNINGSSPNYVWYTDEIVAQVHGASPNVIITGAISTNTPGSLQQTVPQDLVDAVNASSHIVSGYWLNIVGSTTGLASQALSELPQ